MCLSVDLADCLYSIHRCLFRSCLRTSFVSLCLSVCLVCVTHRFSRNAFVFMPIRVRMFVVCVFVCVCGVCGCKYIHPHMYRTVSIRVCLEKPIIISIDNVTGPVLLSALLGPTLVYMLNVISRLLLTAGYLPAINLLSSDHYKRILCYAYVHTRMCVRLYTCICSV